MTREAWLRLLASEVRELIDRGTVKGSLAGLKEYLGERRGYVTADEVRAVVALVPGAERIFQ